MKKVSRKQTEQMRWSIHILVSRDRMKEFSRWKMGGTRGGTHILVSSDRERKKSADSECEKGASLTF